MLHKWIVLGFVIALAGLGASVVALCLYWFFVVGWPSSTDAAYFSVLIGSPLLSAVILVFRVLPNLASVRLDASVSAFEWALRILWTSPR